MSAVLSAYLSLCATIRSIRRRYWRERKAKTSNLTSNALSKICVKDFTGNFHFTSSAPGLRVKVVFHQAVCVPLDETGLERKHSSKKMLFTLFKWRYCLFSLASRRWSTHKFQSAFSVLNARASTHDWRLVATMKSADCLRLRFPWSISLLATRTWRLAPLFNNAFELFEKLTYQFSFFYDRNEFFFLSLTNRLRRGEKVFMIAKQPTYMHHADIDITHFNSSSAKRFWFSGFLIKICSWSLSARAVTSESQR